MLDGSTSDAVPASAMSYAETSIPSLTERADAAARVAALHADDVDVNGRFPAEAFDALREARLLGIMAPRDLGGEATGVSTVVDVCYRLGRACSATAMIYAMHQTKVACVVRHGRPNAWQEQLIRRLCAEQLLFASSTTEGQGGGNVRSSAAAVGHEGGRISLDRAATVISYGAQADAIVTTARRSEEATSSNQVLVAFLKEDYTLEQLNGWNTMGMRGTCSAGFRLAASGREEQILPVPYDIIHSQTMTPVAHLVWSGVWAGIAAAAVERAQTFTRKAARQSNGQMPPGAGHLTRAISTLNTLRSLIAASARSYEAALLDEALLGSLAFQTAITLLKVEASEHAVATVLSALRACGLSGYRNDGDASVSRHLRDVLSSPLMINNDRILANLSTSALMTPIPGSLTD